MLWYFAAFEAISMYFAMHFSIHPLADFILARNFFSIAGQKDRRKTAELKAFQFFFSTEPIVGILYYLLCIGEAIQRKIQ